MNLIEFSRLTTVAEIGVGTVGASWSALMLANGLSVRAFDPATGAEERATALIWGAWPSLVELGIASTDAPPMERLSFHASIEEAVTGADIVQENTPEALDEKRAVLGRIGAAAGPSALVLSSTGGIMPTELQAFCPQPERFIVFHPFNPTHLIPLVEIVPGRQTAPEVTDWAVGFARFLGKKPVRLNAELVGHMTNRLQFALIREAVRCVVEGVASPRDVDAAVRYGLAPRWMLMGGLQTLHLAGGYGGMQAILDHAGPAIETWWQPGEEVHLTDSVKCALVDAGEELSDNIGVKDWMAWRDSELVSLLRAQDLANSSQPAQPLREELGA